MMKTIFSILTICLLTSFLPAQNLGGGLVIGYNASQIDGDSYGGFDKFGASLGGFLTYQISKKFHLQPEILWDQLGSARVNQNFSNRLNYVTVPIFLKFRIPLTISNRIYDLHVHAGPAAGILINAKDVIFRTDITDRMAAYEVRAVWGVTFDIARRLTLGIRYGYSLTSIVNTGHGLPGFGGQAGVYNNYANFSFLYHLTTY